MLLSMGMTFAPGRAFRIPFTTTRSAAVSPLRMAQPSRRERTFHDGAPRDDVVGVDDKHIVALLIVADGTVGNHQHWLRLAQEECARAQTIPETMLYPCFRKQRAAQSFRWKR